MPVLEKEEYIEQAHMFRALANRVHGHEPAQELLKSVREEILSTTKLPLAIDYLLAELNHVGAMAAAMQRMSHYFTPFQTFLIENAESEKSRFDMNRAFLILEAESLFRTSVQGLSAMFFFQFEVLCRNRLSYDKGLAAMAGDPIYDEVWQRWLGTIRHKIGLVELADLVYVHSDYYVIRSQQDGGDPRPPVPILFSEKEGRIALANRRKEPLFFFSALQRQLNYPSVPKPKPKDPQEELLPKLAKLVEKLEVRVKLLEDEQREKGIDLGQFFKNPDHPSSDE
ncbi:MAG: hypothetical protein KF851_02395 [Pirellulaceae bacterium]|nr:hypothetical protein [Pirellulaceae bacterium]